jgi:phenylacetate-coenzyme A ligase PaaK-like adenylate-forming protein
LEDLRPNIFDISSGREFEKLALNLFCYQAEENAVYSAFIKGLGVRPEKVRSLQEIPFLPVELFKTQKIITGNREPEKVFESSGTTGREQSRHYVADLGLYIQSFLRSFTLFYAPPENYVIFALLPSYLERGSSSLVFMAEHLISRAEKESGFFLSDHDRLLNSIRRSKAAGKKIMLIGVSFALLDLAEKGGADLSGVIVMETGGMKGRRKEMIREELHSILKTAFNIGSVHSEYGMTELLSQAYSKGEGIFRSPPWMKVLIRDPHDPFSRGFTERSGGVDIIDLANSDSCAFISTQDLGISHTDGSFEILGRFDNTDIRGCNLLVS